jgi:hypothetical protein
MNLKSQLKMSKQKQLLSPSEFYAKADVELSQQRNIEGCYGLAILEPFDSRGANGVYDPAVQRKHAFLVESLLVRQIRDKRIAFGGRMTGDQFAVVVMGSSTELLSQQLDRLSQVLSTSLEMWSKSLSLTAAAALYSVPPRRIETVIKQVDHLLHRPYQKGRDRIRFELCRAGDASNRSAKTKIKKGGKAL